MIGRLRESVEVESAIEGEGELGDVAEGGGVRAMWKDLTRAA